MKITPNQSPNQALILAGDPVNSGARMRLVADAGSGTSAAGSVLKSVTVTLRADYEAAAPAPRARFNEEPIDVVVTETDAEDDTPAVHGLPARLTAASVAPAGSPGRNEAGALRLSLATPSGFAPVAEYARIQVQLRSLPKGTQLDVHA
jgi:hypothetical protein